MSVRESSPSNGSRLNELTDLMTPIAIRVAATLRLADLIDSGNTSVTALATAAGADSEALARLMRFLIIRGVFSETSGVFGHTPLSERLRSGSAAQAWLDLDGAAGLADSSYVRGLLPSIRNGCAGHEWVTCQSFWDHLGDHSELESSFAELMALNSSWMAPSIIKNVIWPEKGHIVDVGGGTGTILKEILRIHPRLKTTLVERQDVITAARSKLAHLSQQVNFYIGSFFDPLPAGADVYLLVNVLHDWPDSEASTILQRCQEAAGDSGRIVVVEYDINGQRCRFASEVDLRVLVLFGGKERAPAQLETIAANARLQSLSNICTEDGLVITELVNRKASYRAPMALHAGRRKPSST